MAGGEAHILVEHHRLDVGEEDHRDVGHRGGHPGQALLGLQPIEFLVGDVEGDIRLAGLDLGDAAGGVGHEFEHHRLERRLAAPVVRVGLQPQERVALEFLDHVRAGADRRLLETFGADLLVIGLRQHVAGEERHPFEQGRIEFLDVAGDARRH